MPDWWEGDVAGVVELPDLARGITANQLDPASRDRRA